MIVTHTVSACGQRRVYLGGKGSIDGWIEPKSDGIAWSFHVEDSIVGTSLPLPQRRDWAVHVLMALARELAVEPEQLAAVPFEVIAALHAADAFANRRVPVGRRQLPDNAFRAATPGIMRPRADFRHDDCERSRFRR